MKLYKTLNALGLCFLLLPRTTEETMTVGVLVYHTGIADSLFPVGSLFNFEFVPFNQINL